MEEEDDDDEVPVNFDLPKKDLSKEPEPLR